MSYLEVTNDVLRAFAFIGLYFFIGFGPGFVLGLVTANALLGRGAPTYAQTHRDAIKQAAQHNAQWSPAHERWQMNKSDSGASRIPEETGIPE